MTNSHAAWAHLFGAGNAVLDVAADTKLPSWMRDKLTSMHTLANSSNRVTKRELKLFARALEFLGENEIRDSIA